MGRELSLHSLISTSEEVEVVCEHFWVLLELLESAGHVCLAAIASFCEDLIAVAVRRAGRTSSGRHGPSDRAADNLALSEGAVSLLLKELLEHPLVGLKFLQLPLEFFICISFVVRQGPEASLSSKDIVSSGALGG